MGRLAMKARRAKLDTLQAVDRALARKVQDLHDLRRKYGRANTGTFLLGDIDDLLNMRLEITKHEQFVAEEIGVPG
jgi:hypothetical protein